MNNIELGRMQHAIALTLEPPFQRLGTEGVGGASLTVRTQHEGLNEKGIPTTLIGPAPKRGEIISKYPVGFYDLQEMLDRVRKGEDAFDTSSDTLWEVYADERVAEQIRQIIPSGEGILGAHFYTTQGLLNHGWQTEKKLVYFHHSPFTRVRNLYDPRAVLDHETTKASRIRTDAEASLLQKSDAVVFFTEAEADLTRQQYPEFPLDNLRVVPLGIDTKKFNPARKAEIRQELRETHGIPQDATVLYMQARIGASQGQLLLTELYANYLMDNPNLHLAIVGDAARGEDDYYSQIKEYANRFPGRITLTGSLKPEEGHSLGDIGVGFKLETWGYSNLEVMAMGNPLITQDNLIHREVYGGNGGVFYIDINRLNESGYSDATFDELSRKLKDKDWQRYAKTHNPLKVRGLTWQRSTESLIETMKDVVSR